jgi:hypothetical protein
LSLPLKFVWIFLNRSEGAADLCPCPLRGGKTLFGVSAPTKQTLLEKAKPLKSGDAKPRA